jgi:hypothetical protein
MKRSGVGVGTKIFIGFVALILIGAVVGAAGFLSLGRVNTAGNVNVASQEVRGKILEARILEKEYVIKKDEGTYNKLIGCLGELATLTRTLESMMGQSGSVAEIADAQQAYKHAVDEIKNLETDDAKALKDLQNAGGQIAAMAEDETAKATLATKKEISDINEKILKDYSLKEIRNIVAVGHDVLKFHHDQGMSQEAALDAVRNIHFDGTNYFFVVQEDLNLVAHGSDRSLEGKDFSKIQDKKTGKTFMKEVVEGAVKNGESYTEYFWNKPGMGDAVFPKVTYAKYFKPWGLIVCAGVYVDDVEKQVAKTLESVDAGLNKLQQADHIKALMLQARLSATYFFAFGLNAEKVPENLSQMKQLAVSSDSLKKNADVYLETFNRCVRNSEALQKNIKRIDELAEKTLTTANEIGSRAISAFKDNASSGRMFIIGFILIGALIGLVFATVLTRGITGSLRRIAAGLTESSDQVSAASSQVSGASQELAEGASVQAASIEETSSSLEEIAAMTRQNADNAGQAKSLMAETSQVVSKANDSMTQLTSSMTQISKASQEISKIIKTIDEIAFQTNLLALNAAVEAARAGEAGAGFAVVADEVRNLAMRAADAAKNTADLIESTVKRIKDGSEVVEKTSAEFSRVASSAVKMNELVGEIAAASGEQSQGIEQLNKAVSEMDQVVQRNASNAEESAAASEEMNGQAARMNGFVRDLVVIIGGSADKALIQAAAPLETEAKENAHGLLDLFKVGEKKKDRHLQNIQRGNGKDSVHSMEVDM